MRKYAIIFIIGALLILSSSTIASDDVDTSVDDLTVSLERIHEISYVSHGEIYISSDDDFDIQAAAESWEGGGNSTHPYIIEGYEISYDVHNIFISGTSRHFIIRNCNLIPDINPGINVGIYILDSPNARVENVTITQKGWGYILWNSNGIIVEESKADLCGVGFEIWYSQGAQLSDLEAQNCETGIYIRDSDDVTFDIGSIHDNDVGLSIYESDNLQMSKLVVSDNTYEGILIENSNYCTLEDSEIYTCGDNLHAGFNCTNSNYFTATNITAWNLAQGLWFEDTFQTRIEDSYIHDGTQTGINIVSCTEVTIRRTQVESNDYYGVGLIGVVTSLIDNVQSTYNSWEGFRITGASDCTFINSEVANNGFSAPYQEVYASYSDNLLLYNNTISYNHNGEGVKVEICDYANLTQNTIHNNALHGVIIVDSNYCTLDNNTLYLNGQDGIGLYESHYAVLNDQVVHDNGRWGISLDLSDVVTITNCEVSFNVDHGIFLETSNDTVVSHCQIYNNSFFGINTWETHRTEISNCDIYWNFYDGLYAQNCEYTNVSFNDFWENGGGDCEITLDHAPFATIYGNTLIGNLVTQGIYVTWSHNVSIEYNTIIGNNDDGMNIQNSNFTYIAHNIISDNANTGVYLWASSYAMLLNNTIMGNDGHGVYISDCHYSTFDDNEISLNRLDGIYVYESHYLVIEFNDIFDNGWTDPGSPRSGVYVSKSDYCTLNQNTIYNNTVHGVYLGDAHNCTLTSNTIYGNLGMTGPGCGVYLYLADGTIIDGNTIYDNVNDGIYGESSQGCQITDNDIYSNEQMGINVRVSSSWLIQENTIWDQHTHMGIHLFQCDFFVIDSNEIYDNPSGGIRFYQADYCNFTNNLVHDNIPVGVQVDTSEGILVTGNIIYDNSHYGVYLIHANATRIYYNDFVLSGTRDATEIGSTGQNYWDDGISMGNWWWGISRILDDYTITNVTDAVNFDYYPMTSMWIDNATSASFEITLTGNTVTWNAFAHNPGSYQVFDGAISVIGPTTWIGSDITIDVDGLSAGIHNLTIIIYHYSGHNLTAFVEITVSDTTPPVWVSTPVDQVITYGDPLSYQLTATDPSGIASWAVSDIVNFTIVDGLLTNNTVLDVGTYTLEITVQDTFGHTLSVTLTVIVVEPTPPPQPIDPGLMLIILAGGGAAVVVIVVVIVLKKKQSG